MPELTENSLLVTKINQLTKRAAKGRDLGKRRRFLAYGLKVIVGVCGILVTANVWPAAAQAFGLTTAFAILLDSVTSNHAKLTIEAQAAYAYGALLDRVDFEHSQGLSRITQRWRALAGGDLVGQQQTQKALDNLLTNIHSALFEGVREIERQLAAADREALARLELSEKRQLEQEQALLKGVAMGGEPPQLANGSSAHHDPVPRRRLGSPPGDDGEQQLKEESTPAVSDETANSESAADENAHS